MEFVMFEVCVMLAMIVVRNDLHACVYGHVYERTEVYWCCYCYCYWDICMLILLVLLLVPLPQLLLLILVPATDTATATYGYRYCQFYCYSYSYSVTCSGGSSRCSSSNSKSGSRSNNKHRLLLPWSRISLFPCCCHVTLLLISHPPLGGGVRCIIPPKSIWCLCIYGFVCVCMHGVCAFVCLCVWCVCICVHAL